MYTTPPTPAPIEDTSIPTHNIEIYEAKLLNDGTKIERIAPAVRVFASRPGRLALQIRKHTGLQSGGLGEQMNLIAHATLDPSEVRLLADLFNAWLATVPPARAVPLRSVA